MKNLKTNLILFIILIFSFAIRLYHLDTNPAGFFCDEALAGVESDSILKTGRDTYQELPLFFKGFYNDNIDPYQIYLTLPFIAVFGLNETAVRLTPVIFSLIELLVFYLLLREYLNPRFSLLGTLLLSISPWHFYISRISLDAFYSWVLLTLIGCLFWVKTVKKRKFIHCLISSIFLGLATYSYTPARLITPLLFFLLILLFLTKKYFKTALFMGLVYLIVLIPFISFHLNNPNSFQRIKDTVGIDIKKDKLEDKVRINRIKFVLNKYLLYYSGSFLFQKGDTDFPSQFIRRHSISGLGLLYPYQKWLIIAGLIWLLYEIFYKKKSELLFVVFLLLLFPLADSLTLDKTPFATRSYLGVLPFHLLIAFGIYGIYQLLKSFHLWKYIIVKTLAMSLLAFFIITSFATLITKFSQNPLTTSDFWGWQYGPREIIGYFKQVEKNYDELIMEPVFNAPHIFFKFYAPDSCKNCYLGNLENYNPAKKQLFALSSEYLQQNPNLQYITKKVIYYPNGTEAFRIIKVESL